MADHDTTKLSVWAQDLINGLKMRIEELEQTLAEERLALCPDPGNATIIANPYPEESRRPIGTGKIIRFTNGDDSFDVNFSAASGTLEVMLVSASRTDLAVLPNTTNVVRLRNIAPRPARKQS